MTNGGPEGEIGSTARAIVNAGIATVIAAIFGMFLWIDKQEDSEWRKALTEADIRETSMREKLIGELISRCGPRANP